MIVLMFGASNSIKGANKVKTALTPPPSAVATVTCLCKHGQPFGASHVLPTGEVERERGRWLTCQIIHLASACQEGIHHISATFSIPFYPSFSPALFIPYCLSFFESTYPHHPFFAIHASDIKVEGNINSGLNYPFRAQGSNWG